MTPPKPDLLPDEIWVSLHETTGNVSPSGYWPGDKWPCVFKQKRDRARKYVPGDLVSTQTANDIIDLAEMFLNGDPYAFQTIALRFELKDAIAEYRKLKGSSQ